MEPSFLASTHEGQSVALLNAMEWVQHMGLHNIIFVSDTTLLVDAIKLSGMLYSATNFLTKFDEALKIVFTLHPFTSKLACVYFDLHLSLLAWKFKISLLFNFFSSRISYSNTKIS
jgi:hypothetical protein